MIPNLLLWSLQATALVAVAALVNQCLRTARPAARLALWQLTLTAALLLPVLRPWQQEVVTAPRFAPPPAAAQTFSKAPPAAPARSLPTPSDAFEDLLLAGIALKLAHLALGLFRLRQYRRESRPFTWHYEAEILISDAVPSPVTFGFLSPVILLPGHFSSLDGPLQETILYHEILHVRRRDWLFAVAEEFVRAVLWFHPAIWWTIREIHLAREQAVDREVVETLNARDAYVDALLAIAGTPLGRQWSPAPFGSPFMGRRKQLKHRVVSIFREVTMSKKSSVSALLAGCCALALSCWFITGALPLKAAPQEVVDSPGVTVDAGGARLMHRSPVRYSIDLIAKQAEGTVVAQVKTDGSGNVVDATIVSGPDELRKPVLQSLLDWHFANDSANSTRQVTVTFKVPEGIRIGNPQSLSNRRVATAPSNGPVPQMTVVAIEVTGLADSDRDQLLARLPVHVGDTYPPELRADIVNAAHSFDEHLNLGMMVKSQPDGSNQLTLRLNLPNSGAFTVPTPVKAIASAEPPAIEAAAPANAPKTVRIGGMVAAANIVNQTEPVYPPLALAARVQGTVKFEVTIGTDGTVQNLHLVSGPPLLVNAAMQAVQKWNYKPTLLNGNPVEVLTTADVNFVLPPN